MKARYPTRTRRIGQEKAWRPKFSEGLSFQKLASMVVQEQAPSMSVLSSHQTAFSSRAIQKKGLSRLP